MLSVIAKIKSSYQKTIVPVQDLGKHIQQFFNKNRLGGLLDMRDSEFEELMQLRRIYREHLISEETSDKENKASSLFDLKEGEKKLAATEHEIEACFRYETKKNRGDLTSLMESIFQIIKYCVQLRLNSGSTHYTYIDGTAVLFCAEFASWINQIAKQKIDEPMLDEVKNRIGYLFELEEAFPKEVQSKDYAIDVLIFHLRLILEKEVIPQINQKLFDRSSREWFEELERESKVYVNHVARGLCYLYTETENPPDTFNLEIGSDVKLMTGGPWEGTLLGQNLGFLRERYRSFLHSQPTPNTNDFLDAKGSIFDTLQMFTGDLSKNAKQEDKTNKPLIRPGIHRFLNSTEAKKLLLTTLGYLEDYCLLLKSFRQAYRLAGHGGDVLLFLGLCQESNTMLASYKILEGKITTNIDLILQIADEKRMQLNDQREDSPWKKNYLMSKKAFMRVFEARTRCNDSIRKILTRMDEVQTRDYQSACLQQVKEFKLTIEAISQRIQQPDNVISYISTSNNPALPGSDRLKLEDSKNLPIEKRIENALKLHAQQFTPRELDNTHDTRIGIATPKLMG